MSHWPLQIKDKVTVKEPIRSELEFRLPGTIVDEVEYDYDTEYLVQFEMEDKLAWFWTDELEKV